MKNQAKQCLCQAKGVTFISSYAYCEKCGEQLPSKKSSAAVATGGAAAQEVSETKEVYKKRRAGYGLY